MLGQRGGIGGGGAVGVGRPEGLEPMGDFQPLQEVWAAGHTTNTLRCVPPETWLQDIVSSRARTECFLTNFHSPRMCSWWLKVLSRKQHPNSQKNFQICYFYCTNFRKFTYGLKKWISRIKTIRNGDFPGGPVIRNLPSNAGDSGLIPGWGTKMPHARENCMLQQRPSAAKKWINKSKLLRLEFSLHVQKGV